MAQRRHPDRPPIWVDGGQNPKLDLKSFARVSVQLAKAGAARLLGRCARSAEQGAVEMARGRWQIPPHRLGRSGRYLPSISQLAALMSGSGLVLDLAQKRLQDDVPDDDIPPSFDAERLFRITPQSVQPARPEPLARQAAAQAPSPADPDDLGHIRALMAEQGSAEDPILVGQENSPAEISDLHLTRNPDVLGKAAPRWWHQALAWLLSYWLWGLSIPYGVICAGLKHLNGIDLREV